MQSRSWQMVPLGKLSTTGLLSPINDCSITTAFQKETQGIVMANSLHDSYAVSILPSLIIFWTCSSASLFLMGLLALRSLLWAVVSNLVVVRAHSGILQKGEAE